MRSRRTKLRQIDKELKKPDKLNAPLKNLTLPDEQKSARERLFVGAISLMTRVALVERIIVRNVRLVSQMGL
jgi:hypothetical protein